VLAELHGYENDPATVLNDAVVYTSLLAHPYRNNSIGWESDVRAIGRDDLVAFLPRALQGR
jgi:predicted Zn-dependent peptidase